MALYSAASHRSYDLTIETRLGNPAKLHNQPLLEEMLGPVVDVFIADDVIFA